MEFFETYWLEILGTLSGLVCVWLLIKESILTFPIGLLYALITSAVVMEARLYADLLLNLYFVVMNVYGWYFWIRGAEERQIEGRLRVARVPNNELAYAAFAMIMGTLAVGYFFSDYTDADFAYWDSLTTVASFVAMWMTARKYLESWALWFLIDVFQIALYALKGFSGSPGLYFYSFLYSVYLWMALLGWRSWSQNIVKQV
ncbi:MAG: nicotinamide riboside transporter PnuC [Pseudomonadota bacterium]|nr:nicotinamide riboside transporter PnuC [Pseudomonadota bacterium]